MTTHTASLATVVIATAALIAQLSAPLSAKNGKSDAQLVRCSFATTDKCTLTDATLQAPARDTSEKAPSKPASGFKDLFKDMRPGPCKSAVPKLPSSSWPARGEAAVTVCRP